MVGKYLVCGKLFSRFSQNDNIKKQKLKRSRLKARAHWFANGRNFPVHYGRSHHLITETLNKVHTLYAETSFSSHKLKVCVCGQHTFSAAQFHQKDVDSSDWLVSRQKQTHQPHINYNYAFVAFICEWQIMLMWRLERKHERDAANNNNNQLWAIKIVKALCAFQFDVINHLYILVGFDGEGKKTCVRICTWCTNNCCKNEWHEAKSK